MTGAPPTGPFPASPVRARRRCTGCGRAGEAPGCVARGILIGLALAGILWTLFFSALLLLT